MTVEELDEQIGQRGDEIAKLRKEQKSFLKAKDKLVLKQTETIRASAGQTLGDDRG